MVCNYDLILNRNGARDQKIILMKNFNFFLESAVYKIGQQLLILFPANRTQGIFWCHLNFLILTFIFKIVDFAHFYVDLQPIRSKFEKVLPARCSPLLGLVTFQK
jgi:hypothetical protein